MQNTAKIHPNQPHHKTIISYNAIISKVDRASKLSNTNSDNTTNIFNQNSFIAPFIDDGLARISLLKRDFDQALDLSLTPDWFKIIHNSVNHNAGVTNYIDFPNQLASNQSISDFQNKGQQIKSYDYQSPFSNFAEAYSENTFDLVTTFMSLHLLENPVNFLVDINKLLKPDGWLLGAIPGEGSLSNLKKVMMDFDIEYFNGTQSHFFPVIDIRDMGKLLQASKFALPVTDLDRVDFSYKNAMTLINDIRTTAQTFTPSNINQQPNLNHPANNSRKHNKNYLNLQNKPIEDSINLVWFCAFKPHSSQQKPLKPGSADISLTQVLNPKVK